MYQLIDGFLDVVGIFFIVYLIGYSTFLFLSVVVGSIQLYRQHRQRRLQNYLPNDYHMPISIIVPAWNEAVTVVATVHSLLNLEYQAYEVIVVDDGSEDDTSQTLIEAFNMHAVHRPIRRQVPCQPEEFIYETRTQKVPVTVIRKKNGGKADALNMGINAANFPYFICMDADSVLQADSLKKIVQPMLEDRHVVAVGGLVRIANDVELEHGRVKKYRLPRNLLACMQVLEYDRSFLASRILFDQFNGSLIISGAFGLFRKDVVIAAGGYNVSTLGEDMELVVKLHEYCTVNRMDYCIRYATDAICWTQAPERLSDLKKQRRRWHLGLFQSMMKHRGILFNPQFGAVSFISRPSIFLPRYSGVRPIIRPQMNTARMAYIIMFIRPTPLPPKTTFSIMCSKGIMPPRGVRVSCMLLTVPVVKEVVVVVNMADWAMPNRTSLPSMLPMD